MFRLIIPLLTVVSLSFAESNHDILVENKNAIQLKLYDGAIELYQHQQHLQHHHHNHQQLATKPLHLRVFTLNITSQEQDFSEVTHSRLLPDKAQFVPQPKTGVPYKPNELITFFANTTQLSQTAFVLQVFNGEANLLASAYVSPFKRFETTGYRNQSLVGPKGNLVGYVKIGYLVIRPVTLFNPMVEQYISTKGISFAGHRGTGIGIRHDLPEQFIENTIAAFNYVCTKGAPMIELDVQLTSDRIPIIYHDFSVKTHLINRHHADKNVTHKIPLKDLTFKETQQISTNMMSHVTNGTGVQQQSFETLEAVLNKLHPNCGINVEIKYPQLKQDLHAEDYAGIDLNEYVDRILHVLYSHGRDRKMVITSFHSDLCIMVQLKQNKYRVGFLTSGDVDRYHPAYKQLYDPRAHSMELSVAFAQSMHLEGISLLADNVLTPLPGHYPNVDYVKRRHLTLLMWGDALNSTELILDLHRHGVDILIINNYDLLLPDKQTNDILAM